MSPPLPLGVQHYLADQDELQLQVRALKGDWDALIQTAARFPEPMSAIWRVIYDYLVTTERPREGSIENVICAEYVLRVKSQQSTRPHAFTSTSDQPRTCAVCGAVAESAIHGATPPRTPAAQHAFVPEALGIDLCQICKNRANSAIHRPGAPR